MPKRRPAITDAQGQAQLEVAVVRQATKRLAAEIDVLIDQLQPRYRRTVTVALLTDVIATPGNVLLVAKDEQNIARGLVLLTTLHAVSGRKVWIEDFVVDAEYQRRGIGRQLLQTIIAHAQGAGITHINLTARPARVNAAKLYQDLGFERQATNYYRLLLLDADEWRAAREQRAA